MKKFFSTITLALALVGSAFAQNVYSTSRFSASFNGDVKVEDLGLNPKSTGTTTLYSSSNKTYGEYVAVHTIVKGEIAVTLDSANFYAEQEANDAGNTVEVRGSTNPDTGAAQTLYQGHPFTYISLISENKGVKYEKRERIIIVDSKTVVFIMMINRLDDSDRDYWTAFENSLDIK